MVGRGIGFVFATARDFLAKGLVRLGVTPNMITLAGMVITGAAGVCYALGATRRFGWSLDPSAERNAYLLLAGALIVLASACDMLDGAVARLGGRGTEFGAFLDSTLDRYSDFAVYAGIGVAYACLPRANVTFILLSMVAFFNTFMISYARARAEDLIESCKVGWWQRPERSVGILVSSFGYNIPALIVQQAALPLTTVLRRILYTRAVLRGKKPITDPRQGGFWVKIRLWYWPRGTLPYEIVAGVNIAFLLFVRFQPPDPIRHWLGL